MWVLSAIELAVSLAFPGVSAITPATLQARLNEAPGRVVLIDVRTPAEFAVSHLPGALAFNMDNASAADWDRLLIQVNTLAAAAPSGAAPMVAAPMVVAPMAVAPMVVAYCSVGYRSAAFVHQWQQRFGKPLSADGQSASGAQALDPRPTHAAMITPSVSNPQSTPQVLNLQGSLFRWAAEGRPLVNAAGATRLVHGFARPWAWLVPAAQRVVD